MLPTSRSSSRSIADHEADRPRQILPSNANARLPPLQHPDRCIRLLGVEPGEFEDEIRCMVVVCDLERAPSFNAISYTWGDEQPQRYIYIDRRRFPVRLNCHYAIQQARNFAPGVPLWIDSVCIDQEDPEEKSVQVQIMGLIYAKASKVLACIGPSDEASIYLFTVMRRFITPEEADEADETLSHTNQEDVEQSATSTYTLLALGHWAAFTSRPYFSRLWVLQELFEGNGRTIVLCGVTSLNWRAIETSFGRLDELLGGTDAFRCISDGFLALLVLLEPVSWKNSLETILHWTGHLLCADPRDRVYGILRLLGWDQHEQPRPIVDYTLSPLGLAMMLLGDGYFPSITDVKYLVSALKVDWEDLAGFDFSKVDLTTPKPRWQIRSWKACTISMNSIGHLIANLVYDPAKTADDKPMASDSMTAFYRKPHSEVFTNGRKSALVCQGALSGDIILWSEDFTQVLRPLGEGQYQIIGWAVTLEDHHVPDTTWIYQGPDESRTGSRNPELELSSEDVLKIAVLSAPQISLETKEEELGRINRLTDWNLPSPGSILYHESLGSTDSEDWVPVPDMGSEFDLLEEMKQLLPFFKALRDKKF